jgi:hypothetical protein
MSLKRRQRFAKYEQTLLQCGDDIRSLDRFVNAQVVAFRKILKKYKKWTGSSALSTRFRENILSHPKSFTRRDFSQLQSQHDDLLQTLHAALPANPPGGIDVPEPAPRSSRPPSAQLSPSETIVAPGPQPAVGYWNEYECGSEAGDFDRSGDNEYAIYIDPNEDTFPGMKALSEFFTKPIHTLTAWISPHPRRANRDSSTSDPEHGPLLPDRPDSAPYGTTRSPSERSYFTTPPGGTAPGSNATAAGTETDLDSPNPSRRHSRRGSFTRTRGYTSSSEDQIPFPPGYSAHYAAGTGYALPSIAEQRMARYRERALLWATWGCFGVAFVLMGIAAVLIAAGRHKMRLEVDAGVTLGIMTSLGLACAGLCMTGSKRDRVGVLGRLAVWVAFAGVCVVDGVLLVLVMGNAARL